MKSKAVMCKAGVNICPKNSETVYPEIWPDQPENLRNCLSKFSNSLKSMRFNSFMNRNQKKLLYRMGNIFVSL